MNGSFTNVLWYLEFVAFAITLIVFFCFILYLAKINYVAYNTRYDFRQKLVGFIVCYFVTCLFLQNFPILSLEDILITKPITKTNKEPNQRPVCFDVDCVWFCRLIGSITTVAICYFCAYTFISDTKLKFGLFMP